jgi:hypothetical protein
VNLQTCAGTWNGMGEHYDGATFNFRKTLFQNNHHNFPAKPAHPALVD